MQNHMDQLPQKRIAREDKLSWAMLALLFTYMFALNFLMPLHRDDYWYSLIWGTFDKINSWPDIFLSLYRHYFDHGGRMVAYFALDSFLFIGKQWYNPFNALLFVSLMVLMYWYAGRQITWRFQPTILLLIITFSWLGFPHFAEVNLWMAGASGYLFTAVLILIFLLPYYFTFLGKHILGNSLGTAVLMLSGGVLAGWTIENTAVTMATVTAGFVTYFYRHQVVQTWMVTGLIGAVTGFALLIAAPGNFVRAAEQQAGKKIYHLTNMIAAGAETLLYVFPVILFLLLAWRVLRTDYAKKQGAIFDHPTELGRTFQVSSAVTIAFICFLLVSYVNGNFFSQWLGEGLYQNVAVKLGIATDKMREQLANTMSGLEEMLIYLLTMAQLFRYAFAKLALRKSDIKEAKKYSWRNVMAAYPGSYYTAAWIALALFNHFVMIASPRFPARAAFGSVVCLIIASVSVFTIPEVYRYFLEAVRRKYVAFFSLLILLPMTAATLYVYSVIYVEDSRRMAYVATMARQGVKVLEVEPISVKNRVLRHVYFVDLNNHVSKSYLSNYYGLDDIKLKGFK